MTFNSIGIDARLAARGSYFFSPGFSIGLGTGGAPGAPGAPAGGAGAAWTISSSSTSNMSVDPGLIFGGEPRSPYAASDGHTSLLLPPTFICCRPSVQQGMTPLSGNVAGWPRSTELSNTVPSVSVP